MVAHSCTLPAEKIHKRHLPLCYRGVDLQVPVTDHLSEVGLVMANALKTTLAGRDHGLELLPFEAAVLGELV